MSMAKMLKYEAAVNEAILEEMRLDNRVFCLGNRPPDAILNAPDGRRVRVMPMSEAAMTGIAIGAAESGLRPVVLLRKIAFFFVAFDQIANQAAKLRYMFGGQCDFPIVISGQYGVDPGLAAQHNQSTYALFAQIPGLKVVVPSNATEAKGLMKSAIRDPNPVLFFEPEKLAQVAADVGGDDDTVPLGLAATKRQGSDVTVVAVGYMVPLAEQAADQLASRGISVEVIDPRTLVPLDVSTIRSSVRRTGRLVVVDEAAPMCSMASEIAAAVAEDRETFKALQSAVVRVCAQPVPVPYSPPLESFVVPDVQRISAGISAALK